jgi:hypothetical protein
MDESADTEALRVGGFDEDGVLGGIEIDRERAADLGVGGAGGLRGDSVCAAAPGAEREVDDLGRSKTEGVGARAVTVGGGTRGRPGVPRTRRR